LNGRWCRPIQESRAVAEKPRDAVVKFDTHRNLQRHRAILPASAILRLLFRELIDRPTGTVRIFAGDISAARYTTVLALQVPKTMCYKIAEVKLRIANYSVRD